MNDSPHSRIVALLFCSTFGYLGIHRFYTGKVGTGILWLFTFGLFFIGVLVDLIMIVIGKFKDSDGKAVRVWARVEDGAGNVVSKIV